MPSILFIAQHRAERSPSQRFRFEQYIPYFEANGYRCAFSPLLTAEDDPIFYSAGRYAGKLGVLARAFGRRNADVRAAKDFDVVFIQREAFMLGTTYFERAFKRTKAKIVFDFDDAIWTPNVSEGNRNLAWLKRPEKTAEIIALSDLILAGNDYLATYARRYNKNVVVVPTTIDTEEYSPRSYSDETDKATPVCIGWSGSVSTVQHFREAEAVLTRLKELYGEKIQIKLIGDKRYQNEKLGVIAKDWKKEEELTELRSFDIGIMPLPDDEWAKGKCGLKALQYMALAVPTVTAPVGVNADIIQHGADGFLATTSDEWFAALRTLIDSAELRKQIGQAGRTTVEARYSVNSQKDRYLFFINRLIGI